MCSLKKHVLNLEQKHHLPVFCSCCFPENPPTEAARCFFVLRSHLPVLALRSCLAQPHVCSYDVVGGSICGRVCQRWPLLPSQRWCLVKIVGGCGGMFNQPKLFLCPSNIRLHQLNFINRKGFENKLLGVQWENGWQSLSPAYHLYDILHMDPKWAEKSTVPWLLATRSFGSQGKFSVQ